jgi:hypothetical protein
MFYKLLGIFVWKSVTAILRQRYGRTYVPVPVLAGVAVAVLLAVGLLVARRDSDDLV